MERHKSICRVCHQLCPVDVEVDSGKVIRVSGDGENPIYRGYTCVKGREAPVLYNHPDRLLQARKRTAGGGFAGLPVKKAVAEIADRLSTIIDRHGPRAIALFWGSYFLMDNPINITMGDAFMKAIGSPMVYSPNSIDQPGKVLAKGFHGVWMAPGQGLHDPDVALLIGTNPMVSHVGRTGNPGDFPKDLARRGASLIVIDPRRTEIARRASIHLQPRPGQDIPILAGIIRIIIEEDLYDAAFMAEHVSGLEQLREAVAPFTPAEVAVRAGIDAQDLIAAARAFAGAERGYAVAGTGPNMCGRGTLLEYLVLCLDTICGHWLRAGERVRNAITIAPSYSQFAKAQALPPFPVLGYGEKARVRGLTQSLVGMPTGTLAEEILLPGDGQVRALLSLGGNPASCIPDQLRTAEAFRSLDLLVQIDVQMSPTAQLADYVIPAMLSYEMPGTSILSEFITLYGNGWGLPESYAQYTPAIVEPPAGSEVIQQWKLLYLIAQRMGLQLEMFPGFGELVPGGAPMMLDMTEVPDEEELFEFVHGGSRVPLEEVKRHPGGACFPDPAVIVEPRDSYWDCRLDVGNVSMMADLDTEAARGRELESGDFPFRLISRRMMHVFNSPTLAYPANRPRHNPAFLNSSDLSRLGVAGGDVIEIQSSRATIVAVAGVDDSLRDGTLSISHAFGDVPEFEHDVRARGSNPGRLVANDEFYDPYSGQPRMSNVPVRIARFRG